LIQSHDIDNHSSRFLKALYRGDAEEPEESADNLATYSLPIGQLSKRLSRSIMLARKRSAELRARAEEAGAELRERAGEAREDVIERFEEVRDDVVFAARRIEIRVRKGVKKAAERLRREEQ
jgi:hypothetical protein